MTAKSVVILGSTSAIAREIAACFAARGLRLVLAARDQEENEMIAADIALRHNVETLALFWDATQYDSHEKFVEDCIAFLGEDIGGVVLCAGSMDEQATTQRDWQSTQRTLETNFAGPVSILNHFANHLEARGEGFIAAISSVAGDRGRQSNYTYGAAKAGFSAYLQGLRNRLHHSGVYVTTIKPGFLDTKMTWGLDGMFLVASPAAAAKAIVSAIDRHKNVVYVPWFWRYIMWIIRLIPEQQFKRMKM